MATKEEIPTLDLKGLTQNEDDLQSLARAVREAFVNIGFVAVRNHNISSDLITKAWDLMDSFFALPSEKKAKCRQAETRHGWIPLGNEILYNEDNKAGATFDYKECVNCFLPHDLDQMEWPKETPGFRETSETLSREFQRLSHYIFRLIAIALNLKDRDFFVSKHDAFSPESNVVLRYAFYPPIPPGGLAEGQMRCGEHTDFGALALLVQDENGGLEVKRRDGTWIETHPAPGTVMVNIGDMMQRWTADVFISNFHRVTEPAEETKKQRTRKVIAFFLHTNKNVILECLDGSGKYTPISADEYFNLRLSGIKP